MHRGVLPEDMADRVWRKEEKSDLLRPLGSGRGLYFLQLFDGQDPEKKKKKKSPERTEKGVFLERTGIHPGLGETLEITLLFVEDGLGYVDLNGRMDPTLLVPKVRFFDRPRTRGGDSMGPEAQDSEGASDQRPGRDGVCRLDV